MYFLETFKTKEIPVVSADGSKIKKNLDSFTDNMFELQNGQNNKNPSINPKHNWPV